MVINARDEKRDGEEEVSGKLELNDRSVRQHCRGRPLSDNESPEGEGGVSHLGVREKGISVLKSPKPGACKRASGSQWLEWCER